MYKPPSFRRVKYLALAWRKVLFPINFAAIGTPDGNRKGEDLEGAIRNICATTFNQLLCLTALILVNYLRPRSSSVNHLPLLSRTQGTCSCLLLVFHFITALIKYHLGWLRNHRFITNVFFAIIKKKKTLSKHILMVFYDISLRILEYSLHRSLLIFL